MSEKLKPCPFCGSENVEPEYAGYGDWYVMCGSCAAEGPWGETSKDSAIVAWNCRAASPADPVSAEVTKDAAPDLTGLTVEADDDDVNGVCVAFLEDEDDTRLDALMDQLLSIPGMPTYLTADYDGWGIVMKFESEAEAHTALEAVKAAIDAAIAAKEPK